MKSASAPGRPRPVVRFILALLALLYALPPGTSAQPATFPPASFTPIPGATPKSGCDDHRDITGAGYATDSSYLYLRFTTVSNAGWPTVPSGLDEARYKWWLDTGGTVNFERSGNTVNGGEFLLMLEDLTLNNSDPSQVASPTPGRDALGEQTLLDDIANVGVTARWNSTNPPRYTNNTPATSPSPSSYWLRVLGSGTAGAGGPQSNTSNASIGYLLSGTNVDMYVSWAAIGNPVQVCLIWGTDQQNTNLDQAPNCDSEDTIICINNPAAPTATPTGTPTDTPTLTPTQTPTDTPTQTPTSTPTQTPTQTPTGTPTQTPTDTPTQTPTSTSTQTPTDTPTQTPTDQPSGTPTDTPTQTPTDTATQTPTSTPTQTPTDSPTQTPTNTPTQTPTNTPTWTPTTTPTDTPSLTPGPPLPAGDPTSAPAPILSAGGLLGCALLLYILGLLYLRSREARHRRE